MVDPVAVNPLCSRVSPQSDWRVQVTGRFILSDAGCPPASRIGTDLDVLGYRVSRIAGASRRGWWLTMGDPNPGPGLCSRLRRRRRLQSRAPHPGRGSARDLACNAHSRPAQSVTEAPREGPCGPLGASPTPLRADAARPRAPHPTSARHSFVDVGATAAGRRNYKIVANCN